KEQGGVVSHQKMDVDVTCLPNDLPEFIEVDVSGLSINQSLHLADLKAPEGVAFFELAHGRNPTVVSIHTPRAEEPEPTAVGATVEGVPVEGAAAVPGAAPGAAPGAPGAAPAGAPGAAPAADAAAGKKEEAKKEPEKKGKK